MGVAFARTFNPFRVVVYLLPFPCVAYRATHIKALWALMYVGSVSLDSGLVYYHRLLQFILSMAKYTLVH